MATWLGWMVDWGAPITLLGETSGQVARAQRQLARIGIDSFSGATAGIPEELAVDAAQLRSTLTATFTDLADALDSRSGLPKPDVVLDVRSNNDFRAAHVENAVHVPLYELSRRLDDVPAGNVWVHCGVRYRAAAAASLLDDAGRVVVLIDDEFATAEGAGLTVSTPEQLPGARRSGTGHPLAGGYMSRPRSRDGDEWVRPPTAR